MSDNCENSLDGCSHVMYGFCDDCEQESSTELEPAAHVEAETFETECSRGVVKFGAGDGLAELPEGTLLFTANQFLDRLGCIVQEHRERAEEAMAGGNEKERYACASVADVLQDELIQWRNQLEEFTQNGGSAAD